MFEHPVPPSGFLIMASGGIMREYVCAMFVSVRAVVVSVR